MKKSLGIREKYVHPKDHLFDREKITHNALPTAIFCDMLFKCSACFKKYQIFVNGGKTGFFFKKEMLPFLKSFKIQGKKDYFPKNYVLLG